MSDAFPNARNANEPRKGITLLPKDGIAGFDFALFPSSDRKRLGINITVHTEDSGDYHIPLADDQAAAFHKMFAYIANLTAGDREQILNELRQQDGR